MQLHLLFIVVKLLFEEIPISLKLELILLEQPELDWN